MEGVAIDKHNETLAMKSCSFHQIKTRVGYIHDIGYIGYRLRRARDAGPAQTVRPKETAPAVAIVVSLFDRPPPGH